VLGRQGGGDMLGLTPCEAEVLTLIARIRSQSLPWLIIRLIIQTIRWDPSGSVWTDDAFNLSRPDRSGADQMDAEHQATDLKVGGSNPSRCAL
jgi:hypothetical protein